MKIIHGLFGALTGAMMEKDAPHYVKALLERPEVSASDKIAVVGYCFTGAMALRTAAVVPDQVAAAASFHGGQLVTEDAGQPAQPHSAGEGRALFRPCGRGPDRCRRPRSKS